MSLEYDPSMKDKDLCGITKTQPMKGVTVAEVTFKILDDYVQPQKLASRPLSYYRYVEKTPEELYEQVEYDMDEEDCAWLELVNEQRAKLNLGQVSMDTFEQLMDRFEKESFFQCQSETKVPNAQTDEDAICAVCLDGECYSNNVILFCDLCDLAVHQKCYGVPSIPDGSWVCQRCLLSPSKTVECCLCPNRRGAFKQTDDQRWVHVACALWIPEVDFANATFLEPVIGINNVASARWKLVCYVCRQKSAGACVQCAHPSCYTGFHVTCAQQAGLTMAKELVKDIDQGAGSFALTKTVAFCDEHSESFTKKSGDRGEDKNRLSGGSAETAEAKNQLALKKARKILTENRSSCLPLFYPVITVSSIAKISRKMSIEQKEAFISRLHCYWTLKRQSRNGMPLLRSRQFGNFHRVVFKNVGPSELRKENVDCESETKSLVVDSALASKLKDCHRLRQDLEKVRLLIEQVRKREKLKSEQSRLHEQQTMLQLNPLMILCGRALDKMDEQIQGQQLEPDVIEYEDETLRRSELVLKIRKKIDCHKYNNFEKFETDLKCLFFDPSRGGRTKEHDEFKQQCVAVVSSLCVDFDRVGYDQETGLHLPIPRTETTPMETASKMCEKSSNSASLDLPEVSRSISQQGSVTRGRGRGKRKAVDVSVEDSLSSSKTDFSGAVDGELIASKVASSALGLTEKTTSSAPPSGVNRRTAVLFNNKTRKSAKRCEVAPGANIGVVAKDTKPHRRPGRPPKLTGQKYGNDNDSGGMRDKPFMLNRDCAGFGDSELVEKCAKSSADNADFAKIVEMDADKSTSIGSSSLEAVTSGRQSFMQYRGGLQEAKSQKSVRDGPAYEDEVQSRRSLDAVAKESFLQYRNLSMSNSDTETHSDEETSSSSSNSQSDCESTSSQDSSCESNMDSMESDLLTARGENMEAVDLQSLDVVWAKCRGYPWYPALIIDPKTSNTDTYDNGIPIPVPPDELLSLQKKHSKPMLLVLFFDAKRTWQWLPPNKLQPLGEDGSRDQAKLMDGKKPNIRRAVQSAYDKAIQHKALASGEKISPSKEEMDTT